MKALRTSSAYQNQSDGMRRQAAKSARVELDEEEAQTIHVCFYAKGSKESRAWSKGVVSCCCCGCSGCLRINTIGGSCQQITLQLFSVILSQAGTCRKPQLQQRQRQVQQQLPKLFQNYGELSRATPEETGA